jgi:uncharacterized protein (TIGR02145 family)
MIINFYNVLFQKIGFFLICLFFAVQLYSQGVVINDTNTNSVSHDSVILELQSTTKGFLLPRMTNEQKQNIQNPASGLIIYNLNSQSIEFFDGNNWITLNNYPQTEFQCGDILFYHGYNYNTALIGNQCWFGENLRYLPSVVPPHIESDSTPYYYVYGYYGSDIIEAQTSLLYQTYGVLYNFPAANTACPNGWNLPTDEQWKELEMFLGMSLAQANATGWRGIHEGSKLAGSYDLWHNGNLTNNQYFGSSGFSALPSGCRFFPNGTFINLSYHSHWWSASDAITGVWTRALSCTIGSIDRKINNKNHGYSVRCIKN